ncbi:hypothetical protein C4J81_12490 [Deltaproteobacteria bacterium Smac51]|nr:hypothetical protein C4J81_12490 [Deltaproteobacteria bacterium Smac51]
MSADNNTSDAALNGLKRAFLWSCDKIVMGTILFFKTLPKVDRKLTTWTIELLKFMLRHPMASIFVLVFVPTFSFFVLEADGFFEPVSDTIDMFTDVVGALPPDILAVLLFLGIVVATVVIKIKKGITIGESLKTVFYAVAARIFYLVIIMMLVMFILQFTPLKKDRQATQYLTVGSLNLP